MLIVSVQIMCLAINLSYNLVIICYRSLDDVRMNLEVIKYCATVLFLVTVLTSNF